MKYSNFDFEQQILQCWGIVEDLHSVCDMLNPESDKESQVFDILLGVSKLYDVKFNKLFALYESMIRVNASNN